MLIKRRTREEGEQEGGLKRTTQEEGQNISKLQYNRRRTLRRRTTQEDGDIKRYRDCSTLGLDFNFSEQTQRH